MIMAALEQAINQPGGDVIKASESERPSKEQILDYTSDYLEKQFGRKTPPRFAPQTQAARTHGELSETVAENIIYRIEAITAATDVLLRTLSYEEAKAEEAVKFQTGDVAKKQLRERLVRGKARSFAKDDPERAKWEARQSDEKNIRHLPEETLGTITQKLLGWS